MIGTGAAHLALFIPSLSGGGAEMSMLRIAGGLVERDHKVDLVFCRAQGPLADRIPVGVRVIELQAAFGLSARLHALAADPAALASLARPVMFARKLPPRLQFLPDLARYLRARRPDALLAALTTANLVAVWARRFAGVPTRIVLSEQNTLSASINHAGKSRLRHLEPLLGRAYLMADGIVAISDGVATDLADRTGIPRGRITTIYNPVVTPDLSARARAPADHPWFETGEPPVILAVGRLHPQKDFPTLIRAFARLRAIRESRLVILGQAANDKKTDEQRANLMALAASLGVADDLDLRGFVSNPLAYMARSSVFVSSSLYEGLGVVLIEALACGCPVVSTDCPSGPREILDHGRFGSLVPVGDDAALAHAIAATLDAPPPAARLRARAEMFSVERAVNSYLELLLPHAPQEEVAAARC